MSDKFSTISIERLYHLVFGQDGSNHTNRIFGIPSELFFKPTTTDRFRMKRFGKLLETPIGVAAGPHSQMAQNIIAAWLCGARFMELKTVQTLDELEVSKPCIDMQDEGYNCEWSQELKIHESYDEYLNAWIMLHILKDKFGFDNKAELGTIFNMSVGYNLEGIQKENVQWFFEKMKNCKTEKEQKIESLISFYPNLKNIAIPDCISDNITLSTMHGCPSDEIEKIGLYLINEKKLNTTIKLNPTLLGATELRNILNTKLGFKTEVPDVAFEHDLKYPDAIKLIKSLDIAAHKENLFFGLKLTNTLEILNNKNVFGEQEKSMYMSGRALHPISINVARKLQNEFDGSLDISFSAGAHCFNISDILACGLKPITVSSDVLKPGGYGRLTQYIKEIEKDFKATNSATIENFIITKNKNENELTKAALSNLNNYADSVCENKDYKRPYYFNPSIKTPRKLGAFDCISAPCVNTCPTNQDIPEYLYWAAKGDYEKSFNVIMRTNPFPTVCGMVCDHLCQSKCTRINYDSPLLIREVKRFVTENQKAKLPIVPASNGLKAAIIGAGPSGLSCAYFLRLAGFEVQVYETKNIAGGMVADAIPSFRLAKEAIDSDIQRIHALGVKINYGSKIDTSAFNNLVKENNYVYLAIGAQKAKSLGIEGEEAAGILDPLKFLSDVRNNKLVNLGKKVAIIGGGNTAMDSARTAMRMIQKGGKVTIIYRRTMLEMPADVEEVEAALKEGIEILELTAPSKLNIDNGKLKSLICFKMQLSGKDESGRPKPVKIENSESEYFFDTIIPALGQDIVVDFVDKTLLTANEKTRETKIANVFIGGDAYRGAATVIKAIGDGRIASENILAKATIDYNWKPNIAEKGLSFTDYIVKKSTRVRGIEAFEKLELNPKNFNVVSETLNEEQIREEAARCMYCDDVCNVCVTVCPNRANYGYEIKLIEISLKKAIKKNGNIVFEADQVFKISQQFQILNIADFCNECGNCTTFCPTNGAPYKDKPKFHLTTKSFESSDSGYFMKKEENKTSLFFKEKEQLSTLTLTNENYIFETKEFVATLDKQTFEPKNIEIRNSDKEEFNFVKAAEMMVLMQGALALY